MISEFSKALFKIITTREEFTKSAGSAGPPARGVETPDEARERMQARHDRGMRQAPLTAEEQRASIGKLTANLKSDADRREAEIKRREAEIKRKKNRNFAEAYWEDTPAGVKLLDALALGATVSGVGGLAGMGGRALLGALAPAAGKQLAGQTVRGALRTRTRDVLTQAIKDRSLKKGLQNAAQNRTLTGAGLSATGKAAQTALGADHLERKFKPGTVPELKVGDTVIRKKTLPREAQQGSPEQRLKLDKADIIREKRQLPMKNPGSTPFKPNVAPKKRKRQLDPRSVPLPPPPKGAQLGGGGGSSFGASLPSGRGAFSYKDPVSGRTAYKYWNTRGASSSLDKLTGTGKTPTSQSALLESFKKNNPKVDMSSIKWINKTPGQPKKVQMGPNTGLRAPIAPDVQKGTNLKMKPVTANPQSRVTSSNLQRLAKANERLKKVKKLESPQPKLAPSIPGVSPKPNALDKPWSST